MFVFKMFYMSAILFLIANVRIPSIHADIMGKSLIGWLVGLTSVSKAIYVDETARLSYWLRWLRMADKNTMRTLLVSP